MNAGFEYREQIGPEAAGRTVLDHLAARHRHSTIAVWRERIDAGEVFVGEARATPAGVLRRGDWLAWRRPPWEEPAVPLAFAVLYRDDASPGGGEAARPAVDPQRRLPGPHAAARGPRAFPRGDAHASTGARDVGRAVVRADRGRRGSRSRPRGVTGGVEKVYRALVSGVPEQREFTVEAPIGLVDHPPLGRLYAAAAGGKAAVSHVRVLAVRGGNALAEVTIPTGRPHQIRIHMAAAGHPLVGDPIYVAGGVPGAGGGLPGDPGYRLHAHRLRLPHPSTGRSIDLECAPPPDLRD